MLDNLALLLLGVETGGCVTDQALRDVDLPDSEVFATLDTSVRPANHPFIVEAVREEEVRALLDPAFLHIIANEASFLGSRASMNANHTSDADSDINLPLVHLDVMRLIIAEVILVFIRNFVAEYLLNCLFSETLSMEHLEADLALDVGLWSFAHHAAWARRQIWKG